MKISFESPISLLEESEKYNDYEYALVHLFEQYPDYYNFYKRQLARNRVMYLDNSVFELGQAFDIEKFKKYCLEFYDINKKNFYAIAPDVLDDPETTYKNFIGFKAEMPVDLKTICVIQGQNIDEKMELIDRVKDLCNIIALPQTSRFGDRFVILWLIKNTYGDLSPKIHLLGFKPNEPYSIYKEFEELIVSADTSYPVLHGMLGLNLKSLGHQKAKIKMADLISFDNFDKNDVLNNIKFFKSKFTF